MVQPLLDRLSAEEREKVIAGFGRVNDGVARLEAKYDRSIRDRAAVHALLKKTSDDLIKRYQTLFEYSGTAMVVIEDNGTISLANSFCEKIFGYSREDLEDRKSFFDLIEGGCREELLGYHRRRRQGDPIVPTYYEAKVIRKDGNVLDAVINVVLFPGTKQSIASIMDITGRKQMEESLHKKNTELKSFINNIPDMAWLMDANSTFIAVNRAFGTAVGMDPEHLVHKPCEICLEAETAKRFKKDDQEVMASRTQTVVEENFIDAKKGQTTIEIIRSPILDGSGDVIGTVGIARDVTQRKKAEEAIRLANKQLNLLSSITRHDVLNQLMVIRGYLEISKGHATDEKMLGFIEKEEKVTEIIRQQINFTRDYQEIGIRSPQWQDIETIILRAAGSLSMGSVRLSVGVANIEIFADPLLEKVIYNLVENALKHGENLTRIGFSACVADERLMLVCEDDGTGVPKLEKENIFERKFFKHTGFGLFLGREVLAITGISIRETGEPGKGARFEMLVPKGAYRFAEGAEEPALRWGTSL
ncbi:PAS domain S-box protein [Methanoculleus frigidifontis]|nr:PAS domain S-box protein [Methanoculleus sp. FWC-SCC1]